MAERKHTDGPWEINPAEPTQIMTSEKPHELICRTPPKLYANRAEANAHLIAASPTMFEALEPFGEQARHHIADAPEWDDGSSVSLVVNIRDLRAVLAALSKARGDT